MQEERILDAIRVLSSDAALDETQLVERLEKQGFSSLEAGLLVALVPIAFGRPLLERLGITDFSSTVSVPGRAGGWIELPLARFAIFNTALALAKEHWQSGTLERKAYESIALRSAEVNAANRALNEGADIKGGSVASAMIGPPFAEDLGYGPQAGYLQGEVAKEVSRLLEPPSFASLAEALKFLAANLDDNNIAAIAIGCVAAAHDKFETDSASAAFRVRAIQGLRRGHSFFSLRWRYWWRRFPRNATNFTLRLGYIHVDFIRVGSSWKLKEIWVQR